MKAIEMLIKLIDYDKTHDVYCTESYDGYNECLEEDALDSSCYAIEYNDEKIKIGDTVVVTGCQLDELENIANIILCNKENSNDKRFFYIVK